MASNIKVFVSTVMVKYSIIIPVKAINDYIRETVSHIQTLDSNEWELIILPNEFDLDEWNDSRIRIISSGRVGPADKRDLGASFARGEFLVFLDDDSYPNSDLLKVATPYFKDARVVAIGGPAITPPNDSFWQKVSGAVFLSKFSGGNPERYIPIGEEKEIYDWPSVNFIVKKKDFIEIGGFSSPYWPGEDTKLCLDLLNKTGKKIIYVPSLIVWHHRREGFLPHLRQISAYGLHRGYFARVYPENSRKLLYLMPSIFFMLCIFTLFYYLIPINLNLIIIICWIIYLLALVKSFFDILKYENWKISIMAIIYIPATHFCYGFSFLRGLFKKNLISKLR